MTRIIEKISEISGNYDAILCDLWGCLHNGETAFREAVEALQEYRRNGGLVVLLTNAPRPARSVEEQLDRLGAPRDCYDGVATSGDSAQAAMAAGMVGRRVYHLGPSPKDDAFFTDENGKPIDVTRVPLDEAEGIVATGLFDDLTETPEDYRHTILTGVNAGLKMLCANPDIIVDKGETRLYCAGALAQAYEEAGGEALYFGKPHAPIYQLARQKLAEIAGRDIAEDRILAIGDGIHTDVQGALGEGIDCVFVSGGLAAEDTATSPGGSPDADLLNAYFKTHKLQPLYAIGMLR